MLFAAFLYLVAFLSECSTHVVILICLCFVHLHAFVLSCSVLSSQGHRSDASFCTAVSNLIVNIWVISVSTDFHTQLCFDGNSVFLDTSPHYYEALLYGLVAACGKFFSPLCAPCWTLPAFTGCNNQAARDSVSIWTLSTAESIV